MGEVSTTLGTLSILGITFERSGPSSKLLPLNVCKRTPNSYVKCQNFIPYETIVTAENLRVDTTAPLVAQGLIEAYNIITEKESIQRERCSIWNYMPHHFCNYLTEIFRSKPKVYLFSSTY